MEFVEVGAGVQGVDFGGDEIVAQEGEGRGGGGEGGFPFLAGARSLGG